MIVFISGKGNSFREQTHFVLLCKQLARASFRDSAVGNLLYTKLYDLQNVNYASKLHKIISGGLLLFIALLKGSVK